MATPEFAEALHRFVLEPSRDRVVAVMCAEAVPWRCHRSLLADALVARGVAVKHVIDESEPRAHTPTPFAVVDDDATVRYPAPQQQLLP